MHYNLFILFRLPTNCVLLESHLCNGLRPSFAQQRCKKLRLRLRQSERYYSSYSDLSFCQSWLNFSTASSVCGSVIISSNTRGAAVISCAPAASAEIASCGDLILAAKMRVGSC